MSDSPNTPITVTEINKPAQTIELPGKPEFMVLLHQQGIRVDVPNFIEINSRTTIDCIQKLTQRQWTHISTGSLFQHLFKVVLPDHDNILGLIPIPETVEALKAGDFGIQHICGLIILSCEAIFTQMDAEEPRPIKLFFREIESHLHPSTQRRIINLITELRKMMGQPETTNDKSTGTETQ
jgi:hypothetical protein